MDDSAIREKQGCQRRSIRSRLGSLLLLGVLSGVGAVASLVASYRVRLSCPWLGDLLMNIGAIAIGVLVAVFFVDKLLSYNEQRQWQAALTLIAHYVERISNRTILGYREALGYAEEALPRSEDGSESTDHERLSAMGRFARQTLLPSASMANLPPFPRKNGVVLRAIWQTRNRKVGPRCNRSVVGSHQKSSRASCGSREP